MSAATLPRVLAALREEGVRCHCGGDRTGHPLGVIACEAPRITRPSLARPEVGGLGDTTPAAAGTCPRCHRPGVKVTLRTVRTAPNGHDLMPGIHLADVPGLAVHRTPGRGGKPCDGAGERPVETRYRFPELEAILRTYGPGAVTR